MEDKWNLKINQMIGETQSQVLMLSEHFQTFKVTEKMVHEQHGESLKHVRKEFQKDIHISR